MRDVRRRAIRLLSTAYRLRERLRRRSAGVSGMRQQRAAFYTRAWCEAAEALDAVVTPVADGILEIRRGGAVLRVRENTTDLDGPITLDMAGSKPLVYRLLGARGLSIPPYAEFTLDRLDIARRFLAGASGACVVKPADGYGGRGVTTEIRSGAALVRASALAAAHGRRLLIEQQIPGDVYRLLYLDGQLLDAVRRDPPRVTADGRSTIRELVERENRARLAGGAAAAQVLIGVDLDMRRTLAAQGLTLRSRPPRGTVVRVKTAINENGTRDNVPAAGLLCESILADGARAAAAVGVRLAGIDVLTTDPSRPLDETGGVVLEVNTTPGHHYHYHRDGPAVDVARSILAVALRDTRTPRLTLVHDATVRARFQQH
jgi:cyanophycin synthetase